MKNFKTREKAEEFFKNLNDTDYIFFANQCFEFYYYHFGVEDKNKSLVKEKNDLFAENQALESKIKSLGEEKKTLEQTNEAEKRNFENKQLDQINEAKKEEQERKKYFEDKIEKKDEKISCLQVQRSTDSQLRREFETFLRKLDERSKKYMDDAIQLVKKPEKSQEIGVAGERIVERILNEYPFLKLEKITKPHMGDFHVGFRNSNVKVMIEVKNYKNESSIPEEDINKFIKDLNENSGVHCGLLLSLKTKFANKYQQYKVYKTIQDKPYIMINNLLARTHYEIPLLFALSAIQMVVESKSIQGEEATKIVDKCIKQWSELLKSAMTMEKSAIAIQREAKKLTAKIRGEIENTRRSLGILNEEIINPDEESSLSWNVSDLLPPSIKKRRFREK